MQTIRSLCISTDECVLCQACWSGLTAGSMQFAKAGTFAPAHDKTMMGHIKDTLPFSLLLHRGTAALDALPDLAPTMTLFRSQW